MKISKGHNYVDDEMKRACMDVLDSHQYYLGPQNDQFEAEVASFLGVRHAVAVNSGSSAMFLILQALGIGPGDEVIVPAAGFVTLAEAVAEVGARARFVDIEMETYNLDPEGLDEALTTSVKAIVPAHDYGHPADMDAIEDFAQRHDLFVVEDCCHALGAAYRGKHVGGLGTAGFLSFAGKSVSVCGLGGMVTTNDERLAHEIRLLRDHGRPRSQGQRFYDIQRVGYNLRLSELHAAIGRVQLRHLEDWNKRRRDHAAYYTEAFKRAGLPIVCPTTRSGVTHAFLHYTIRVDADYRDGLKDFLAERGIQTSVLYPVVLYLLPPYVEAWGHRAGDFPNADLFTDEILSLPSHPSLTEDMLALVVSTVTDFFQGQWI
jgi:dTDP-4-amino-4,6-dideoxygalactose transaminase